MGDAPTHFDFAHDLGDGLRVVHAGPGRCCRHEDEQRSDEMPHESILMYPAQIKIELGEGLKFSTNTQRGYERTHRMT